MGGIATPNPMMTPPAMNPILAEIDAAHASLSPDAQAAIEKAHGIAAPNAAPMATEPPPGGGIQAPAPTTVGGGINPPSTDNVSSAAIKPAGVLSVPSLGSKMPETTVAPIGSGQVSDELKRLTKPPIQGVGAHTKADTGQPGWQQIHNPWARIPLGILDALGRGFFPGVEMAIPGTSGHHDVLVHQRQVEDTQERDAANDEAKREQETASAGHLNAEADALKNPQAKQATNLVELFQKDPAAFARYQEATQKAVATKEPQFIREEGATGKIIGVIDGTGKFHSAADPTLDPQAHAIMDASKGKQPTNATEMFIQQNPDATAEEVQTFATKQPRGTVLSADDKAVIKAVGGDPTVAIEDQPLAIVQKFLAKKKEPEPQHAPQGQMLEPDGKGGYVSKLVTPGAHVSGAAITMGGENTLNTPTSIARSAGARAETMLDLDARIRTALSNPELAKGTGPIEGRLREIQGKYGSLPHDLAELNNDLISYGAFQAGLHPIRGIGGIEYFEKVMGGLHQDPAQLLGKLDSNRATAESVIKQAGGKPREDGGSGTVPHIKDANDYNALKPGPYIDPYGVHRIKK